MDEFRSPSKAKREALAAANAQLVKRMLVICALMFGFAFSLVPLYEVFCEITGLNGKTGELSLGAAQASQPVDRWVTVQFDATVNSQLPWAFSPEVPSMKVQLGRLHEAWYIATNTTSGSVTGQAIPSVAPREGSLYFNKTECFCFTAQQLAAGEQRRLPVRFIVDPHLPAHIQTVTLSYTFFRNPGSGDNAG